MKTLAVFAPHTLADKLRVYIGLATAAVLTAALGVSYFTSSHVLEREMNEDAAREVSAAATLLDKFVDRVGTIPRVIAVHQQTLGETPKADMIPFLVELLRDIPSADAYGVYMAFENADWRSPTAMQWVDRETFPKTAHFPHDYHQLEWYTGPKQSGLLYVTEPYFDRGGSDITMITISRPVTVNGRFIGVAAVDLALEHVHEIVADLAATVDGRDRIREVASLASQKGKLLVHPDANLILDEDSPGADISDLPEGRYILASAHGSAESMIEGVPCHLYWATAPHTGWKVMLKVRDAEIYTPAYMLTSRLSVAGVVSILVMLWVVSSLARRITEPLKQFAGAASDIEIEKYEFDQLEQVGARDDELGHLARVFRQMAEQVYHREQRLKQQVQELKIEIDEGKKAKHVAEITESDYFQDLQKKVGELRRRTSGT